MISTNTVQAIKDRLDIVDVIDAQVKLKKMGKNHSACCPFHDEKSPSFTVSFERQFYYCFGCGATGDLIKFYQEYNGLGFQQAIETLAGRAGITIDKTVERIIPKAIKETMQDDRMIILMADDYIKSGVKMTYADKQRTKLARSRYEGYKVKYNA